ncbi:MAG TPA: hypothetical protein VN549_00390 [Negativicutes bacterium]|nr:hypothetical protein [Negativicutes bacterium]
MLKIVLSVFVIFILVSGGGMFFLGRGLESGAALEVNACDASTLGDGTYTGEYKGGRWSNKVVVTVENHKIIRVDIAYDMLIPREEVAAELVDRVLEKQTTKVDVVSGATVT